MAEFLKAKEAFKDGSLTIQPLTRDGIEKFSVWDNFEKKFYNEGSKIKISSGEKDVNKYIKLSDKDKERFNRNLKVSREVLVNNKQVTYDMPTSVDQLLLALMDTVAKMGKDPLKFDYVVSRTGTGIDTKYEVVLGKEIVFQPEATPEPEISLDEDEEVDYPVTEKEIKVIEAIKKKYPNHEEYELDVWIDLLKRKLGVTEERAVFLAGEYLNVQ